MLALLAALATGPAFLDQTEALGLAPGGGQACWIDLDQDGWTDVVTAGFAWRNVQGKQFEKIAPMSDAVAADFDNDGFPDLFCYGPRQLFRNIRGKAFEPVVLPELPASVSLGACWGDLDGDGFPDLYVGGYEDWDRNVTYPSLVLRNLGGRGFQWVRQEAKFRTRGVTACDFDQDGDTDVYASNYRLQPNQLLVNDGKAALSDRAAELNAVATSPGFEGGHSIGAAWGDFDEDGLIDLFAGNFAHVDSRGDQPKSRFLRNLGKKEGFRFDDKGTCGVFYQESYASPAAADYDTDGRLDLFFTTVYATASFGRPNFPVLFRNEGDFRFSDATASAGLANLGATYQAAWADFDQDGDVDLMTAGRLFVNHGAPGRWLAVRVRGDGKRVGRSAIGTQVRVRVGKRTLTRQVEAGTGQGNQNDLTLHFGLGDHAGPVDIEIAWPGGRRQTLRRQRTNQILDVGSRA